jgi:hypothetical protein
VLAKLVPRSEPYRPLPVKPKRHGRQNCVTGVTDCAGESLHAWCLFKRRVCYGYAPALPGPRRAASGAAKLSAARTPAALEKRIRDALATPGRPGFHKIAAQFGVATGTVQRIARI